MKNERVEIAKQIEQTTATSQEQLRHEELELHTEPLPNRVGVASPLENRN
ncbi:DUF2382 domain-containing protein [Chamaesiphon sp. GL140_3_metabinner_50]|nr:DUF2382 domain-containing protein [Chamaesiphon sp. GL140_3_metabinner_50]